jgi:hypothetical protein
MWVATGALGAGDAQFTGRLQHFAVFDYALTKLQADLLYNAGTYLYEQEGYRWREDDGSESGASWIDTQDTPITRPITTGTRLRVLTDAYGDAPSQGATLQYRKAGTIGWRKIS